MGKKVGTTMGTNFFCKVNVDFAESIVGVQKYVQYMRVVRCSECKGERVKKIADDAICRTCHGSGEHASVLGEVCPTCLGTGVDSIDCPKCKGDGVVSEETQLLVKIPKSVDNGMLLRIKEKGDQALNGNYGDLILQVTLEEHPEFKRKGFDIYSTKKISVTQAIIGGQCEVDTIHGKKKLQIAPGTEHNHEIRIRGAGMSILGKGMQSKSAGSGADTDRDEKGDHIVVFKIAIPSALTKEQKAAIESYAKVEDRMNL